ncbi:MAG: hypothetical protein B6245_09285 [Desulfobacteraceae bacterium 4572_88]|nr:MAG: hypothetical protein B6245_09285 [Desulfobacteraceae bacterium 4572_88]
MGLFKLKKIHTEILCVIFMVCVTVFPLNASMTEIYVYVDENGIRHFTNIPTSSRYRLFLKGRSYGTYSSSYSTTQFDDLITEASELYDVSFPLVKAIIKVESNFNPRAVSKMGAQGLMQLMPGTARLLKVSDPFDPWENIRGGTRYFKMMMNRFDGKLSLALASYNAGPERVERHKGIPPIRETQNYVKLVMKHYHLMLKGQ